MISCTDFIPAYSELFKFLEEKGGKEAVTEFWNHLSDTFLTNLRDLVSEHGIRGCWEYWSHTLNEEAADFTMELDEEEGKFSIVMHHCPSKGRLLELSHVEPYHDYCGHCVALYTRVLEPLGYHFDMDLSEVDQAKCSVVITRRKDDSTDPVS
jgi:predicted ArsR family transcriptional regulator